MRVSLVRVGQTWHVFKDWKQAYTYYQSWREFQDSEYLGEQHVNDYREAARMLGELMEDVTI